MENYKLSYVITTYNKLSYLKITLPKVIEYLNKDEEIVVIDGGSNDGTAQYLSMLHEQGKIQQYLSEPDKGESHGINKGMLMARGELIKLLTDDDAYHFDAIGKCKDFMLSHSEVDVLGFDGYGFDISNSKPEFLRRNTVAAYKNRMQTKQPFIFCGLSLMIRKSALPLLGLFNTTVKIIDFEYTMRITSLRCNLAWYSGCGYVNIANSDSNSVKFWKLCKIEMEKINYMYLNILPFISFEHIDRMKESIRSLKRVFVKKPSHPANLISFKEGFEMAIEKVSQSDDGEFLI